MPKALAGEISRAEAARRLGITVQAIGQWASKVGAPVRHDGTAVFIRWPDFARWREQEIAKGRKPRASAAANAEDANSPAMRKAIAEAARAEHEEQLKALELAKALEQTVSMADLEATVGRILDRLSARLRAMAFAFSHLGDEVERALEVEIERVITDLHGFDADIIDEDDEDENDEDPAAEADAA